MIRKGLKPGHHPMHMTTVTGLFIYPVKSMQGIALDEATLTAKGLLNDRLWMVVKENGRFVTQRDIPRMALVNTGLDETGLTLSIAGQDSMHLPFAPYEGQMIETKVWGDRCQTIDQGEEISRWLTRALASAEPLRLVRMSRGFERPQNKAEIYGVETTTNFADAAPFLVANEASLERLNSVLEANQIDSVPMNRFRPNLVVKGLEPFAEHKLAEMSASHYSFQIRYPCKRCIVTTIDQDTAQKDPQVQPFKTLQIINPMPGREKGPAFAENATLAKGDGQNIRIGDKIQAIFKQT